VNFSHIPKFGILGCDSLGLQGTWQHVGACPATCLLSKPVCRGTRSTGYRHRHLMPLSPEDPAPAALPDTKKAPGRDCRGLGYVLSQVTWMFYSEQIGGEILHVCGYCVV
jgi:hypothetical protein